MTLPVEYRLECDTNAPAVRIFHGAKDAKEENKKLEARNPKIETNPNDTIPNLQNYRIE